MSNQPSPASLPPSLSAAIAPTSLPSEFISTREYRRFVEFCEACRRYRYIGLCFGPPGVGKTLSARRFTRADRVEQYDPWGAEPFYGEPIDTAFYTPPVVNTPAMVASQIRRACEHLHAMATGPVRRQAEIALETIRLRNESYRRTHADLPGSRPFEVPPLEPTYHQTAEAFEAKKRLIPDPTRLVVVDEVDRLRMTGLEQLRALFDAGTFGLVLIGMPGMERRLARFPQLYSRIGFVHELRPLDVEEMRLLLDRRWAPPGVRLPGRAPSPEAAAALMRVTGGNFRLLTRMLTQIERILEINGLEEITKQAVDAARESLVIGEA